MIHLKELAKYLSEYLAVDQFQDYGPNGIQVEGKKNISKIGFGVSATLATIEEAIDQKCDALIVHHGMFWEKDPYPIVGSQKRKLKHLLDSDITLLAYHLPLDAHKDVGNNFGAAKSLGWNDLKSFEDIGVQGSFAPVKIESFIESLETFYGHQAHTALGGKEHISNAVLVSGGAYKLLKKAASCSVDCFITGNFDEPAWGWSFEENIHFIALGHAATETIGVKLLQKHLEKHFSIETGFLNLFNPF